MSNLPKTLGMFGFHGINLAYASGEEYAGNCPFCLDESHFYVNSDTTQYECKKCHANGNGSSFLLKYLQRQLEDTELRDYKRLKGLRGIQIKTLKRFDAAWDGSRWLLPSYGSGQMVSDLRTWKPKSKQLLTTKGCKVQLFGLQHLRRNKSKRGTLWLCEGEWDAMALDSLLRRAGRTQDVVLAVPGAGTFKDTWVEYFTGRKVRICYDNDDAGDRGSKKAASKIAGAAKSISFLCWPDSKPSGWDIRDHCTSSAVGPRVTLNRLNKLFRDTHRRQDPDDVQSEDVTVIPKFKVVNNRPSFETVLRVFSQWLDMDSEMIKALKIMLAVIISEQFPGSPLWMYLVGPSGAGKTLILCSAQGSDQFLSLGFQSRTQYGPSRRRQTCW